tara:strand:- start:16536 stop:17474 length:939 start_codon:yes stop_codon:yes gene_type:complete
MTKQKSLSGALNVLEALSKKTVDDYVANQDKPTSSETPKSTEFVIHEIDTNKISRWKYKDRPLTELGDIQALADELKQIGQQQPCIVRPLSSDKYELIVGERRWLAAQHAGLKLKAVIKAIDDNTSALIQAAENESRLDLTDFSKGMSLARLIENKIITQKDLQEKLGKSKQQVSRLLSFSRINKEVFESINDFSKVSARTAYEISRLSNKGDDYVSALIKISIKISSGKFGASKIIAEIDKMLSSENVNPSKGKKIYDPEGRHLFTWRTDNNSMPSVHFPADIAKLIHDSKIDLDQLNDGIKNEIYKQLRK